MQNAIAAVCALAGKRQLAAVLVKLDAPLDQLFDLRWPFRHQRANRVDIAQPRAGLDRVLFVKTDFVVVAQCHGDAALRVL